MVATRTVQSNQNYCERFFQFIYTNKLPYRDHLQTSNPEESSATDKSLYSLYSVQLQVSHSVENSATNKSLCREFSYHQVTL